MEIYNSNKARFIYTIIEKMIPRLGEYDIAALSKIQNVISNSENELDDSIINDLAEEVVLLFFPETAFSVRVN